MSQGRLEDHLGAETGSLALCEEPGARASRRPGVAPSALTNIP